MKRLTQFLALLALLIVVDCHSYQSLTRRGIMVSAMVRPFVRVSTSSGSIIRTWAANDKFYAYILTCAHSVDHVKDNKVDISLMTFSDNGFIKQQMTLTAGIIEIDKINDFAILWCETPLLWSAVAPATEAESSNIGLFDTMYSVGRPNSESMWVRQGTISTMSPARAGKPGLIGHNAEGWYGVSGGPVFNANYKQIGISCRMSITKNGDKLEGMQYFLPIYRVYKILGPEKAKQYFGV